MTAGAKEPKRCTAVQMMKNLERDLLGEKQQKRGY